jgi:hypothetical protein
LATVGLERACVGTARLQRLAAVGAGRLLAGRRCCPIGSCTRQRQIFEHTRSDVRPAGIEFVFDLAERGFGMLQTPFAHPSGNLLGHPMPGLLVKRVAHRIAPVDIH